MSRARPWSTILALMVWLGLPGASHAVSFALTEAEQAAAIKLGEQSVESEDFGGEWKLSAAGGEVMIMTPFHRLALAARQAAFKKRPLRPRDVQTVLREDKDRLVVWVSLHGPRTDFARYFEPVLTFSGGVVPAIFVQNERTAMAQPDGVFLARNVYGFLARTIPPKAPVVLVVKNGDAEVARFTVNLGGMR
jgi:hypothetical protein